MDSISIQFVVSLRRFEKLLYTISLSYLIGPDRAFPVPRSIIVSLVALFTACSNCSRTLIYDKCSTARGFSPALTWSRIPRQYIRSAIDFWERFNRSEWSNCSSLYSSIQYSHRCERYARWSSSARGDEQFGFLARDSIYAIARYMPSPVRLSVCLSVCLSRCPSHGWISQRRLKLGSRNFHHRVAPWL